MKYLIGIDEAGRGPLAGPVAVGVAMVPIGFDWKLIEGVKDSKKLSPIMREKIFETLCSVTETGQIKYAVRFSSSAYIDRYGIVPAISRALAEALSSLNVDRDACEVLLDGGLRAPLEYKNQKTIIRGDQSEPVISLASIAAKVLRDRHMQDVALRYPDWQFEVHKGYGTLAHRKVIAEKGLSGIHRATFCTRLRISGKSV